MRALLAALALAAFASAPARAQDAFDPQATFREAALAWCYSSVTGHALIPATFDPIQQWDVFQALETSEPGMEFSANARVKSGASGASILIDTIAGHCFVQGHGFDTAAAAQSLRDALAQAPFNASLLVDDTTRTPGGALRRASIYAVLEGSAPNVPALFVYEFPESQVVTVQVVMGPRPGANPPATDQ